MGAPLAASDDLPVVYRCVPTDADDLRLLASLLRALHPLRALRCLTIPGQPLPKGRPRFSRSGHAYVSRVERRAVERLRATMEDAGARPDRGRLAVAALFARSDLRRCDADNLQKMLLDAGNGVMWADDSQIATLLTTVVLDRRRPRTVVALSSLS